ncbi:aminoglycoside phosphotransferase family protein [Nocardia uniformis]|uniref:Aminoglycoside phosphotransferase family protein n=1 Tax=Nocardia uniformis TaxID=53432 RepID=A0A849CGE2_9NOCA|nr:aminoglycoside phosphotransferase family protein [Nocardia uniformis]NNH76040.1 aminoglycoside phosphotransferase family protein [Nocardia uniformis]
MIPHDATTISTDSERELLRHYGLTGIQPLGVGTEAHVYALETDRVLKIYADRGQLEVFDTLRDFHDRLDTSAVPWTVPRIHDIARHGDLIAVVEDRVAGTTMDSHATGADDEPLEQLYLQTVQQMSKLMVNPPLGRRLLLPAPGSTGTRGNDWNEFITNTVSEKLRIVAPLLRRDIDDIDTRADCLLGRFSDRYDGPDAVVHGDLYPGNILMTDRATVTGIIDFGTFTMIGDPLYDLATACGFWRMYEPDHATVRNRLLDHASADLPAEQRRRLMDYLLIAALTTCDLYPEQARPIHDTGHYQWALGILTDNQYWYPTT